MVKEGRRDGAWHYPWFNLQHPKREAWQSWTGAPCDLHPVKEQWGELLGMGQGYLVMGGTERRKLQGIW